MEEDVRDWFIEMHWTCKHCKTRNPGMSGEERESLRCVTCGAEKSTEGWEMPDAAETAAALSGDALRRAKLAPNWHCLHCRTESRANKSLCEECGAPRGSSPEVAATAPDAPPKREPQAADYRTSADKPTPPSAPPTPRVTLRAEDFAIVRPETPWAKIILGVVAAFLGIWFFAWLLSPNHTIARVTQTRWERRAVLSAMHDYQGEGWRDDAPPLVFEWTHCETRQHGTHACNPHNCNCRRVSYDCNCSGGDSYSCNCSRSCSTSCTSQRNGSARCRETCRRTCDTCRTPRRCSTCYRTECSTCFDQCPTWAQWCSYRYHRWDVMNRGYTQGDDHAARWPGLQANGERERLERTETYRVDFADTASHRTWQITPDFARYETFHVGERYRVEWTRAGSFTVLSRERP